MNVYSGFDGRYMCQTSWDRSNKCPIKQLSQVNRSIRRRMGRCSQCDTHDCLKDFTTWDQEHFAFTDKQFERVFANDCILFLLCVTQHPGFSQIGDPSGHPPIPMSEWFDGPRGFLSLDTVPEQVLGVERERILWISYWQPRSKVR